MVHMTDRWLSNGQQRSWRSFLLGVTLLMERIDRDMREKHGLSMPEYELLVRLSEAPDHELRMAELADSVKSSRSRITHTIRRLEAAGFVVRRACESDGRGVQAVLTDDGYAKLVAAAPDHVDTVRDALVDVIDAKDFEAIGRAFEAVADRLETGPPDTSLRYRPLDGGV
jgi:DNA-binding MarR family transcriptional regulator